MKTNGRWAFWGLVGCSAALFSPAALAQTNTATGVQALNSITTGLHNTATGYRALYLNTTGNSNSAHGRGAMYKNTTGSVNTAAGEGALYRNTTGTGNTGVGAAALQENTAGHWNTAVGWEAMFNNTEAHDNSALGMYALRSNTTGNHNTAVGSNALRQATTAHSNTAIGSGAMDGLGGQPTTGWANTAVGVSALGEMMLGGSNTAMGAGALGKDQSGSFNVAIGAQTMALVPAFGDYNTAIGYGAGPASGYSNTGAFGNGAIAAAPNTIRIGNSAITSIGGQVAWSNLSDARFKKNVKANVPGLDFIQQLRPVTYSWDLDKLDSMSGGSGEDESARRMRAAKVHTGFLAQEVEAAAKSTGYDFDGVVKPANAEARYELQYSQFVVPLVRAVQEQQKEIEELRAAVQRGSRTGHQAAGVLGNVSLLAAALVGALLATVFRFRRTAPTRS